MKVAVVGGGVSGLSAIWALNEYSSHEVHLFEPLPWIGGHANTVKFTPPTSSSSSSSSSSESTPVDTGFIVFNKVTYPNFLRFLNLTGVKILDSDMSFSVTRHIQARGGYGAFEWAGGSVGALFCQLTNTFNPGHWRMVWDIIRFNHESIDYLRSVKQQEQKQKAVPEISIGEWLAQRSYSSNFTKNYLIPMTASIWSTAPETTLASFPAITLLRFMHNHHLLQILDRPQWLTISQGSKSYVERILSKLDPKRIHQGNQKGEVVSAFITQDGKWTIQTADGESSSGWDKVIFACHADQTVRILQQGQNDSKGTGGNTSMDEVLQVLKEFKFSENVAVLHTDERLMPVRKNAWSAWNFLAEIIPSPSANGQANGINGKQVQHHQQNGNAEKSSEDVDRVSLTYWMNLLQNLPISRFGPILVTLNPSEDPSSPYTPKPELVVKRQSYTHPLYTPATVVAQKKLKAEFQGKQGIYFAGAWTNYGFHEDGFTSGLRAANALPQVYLPFDIKDAERKIEDVQPLSSKLIHFVDKSAKSWPVRTVAHIYFLVLLHVLSVALFFVQRLGLPKNFTNQLHLVKSHWKDSVASTQNKASANRNDAKIKST